MKKILVVGASIAGPAVCYWLKQFGFAPTLIERGPCLRKGGYAIDIRGSALDIVKEMGIYEQIGAMRTQLDFGRYIDVNGCIIREEQGEKAGFREGDDVEIVRGDLVEILMQTIQDVPCYFGQSIQQIEQYPNHVKVLFKEGRTEEYDLVIGADGLNSSTRKLSFTSEEYNLFDLGFYICIFSIPNYLDLHRGSILLEVNQKSIHVSSEKDPKAALVGFMFRSQQVMQNIDDEAEQKNFVKSTFYNFGWETNKLLELMETSTDFYFDSITQVKMNAWTKGRVALVGDAGYCASPLSGQGTSLALVGAYLLAGELKRAEGNYALAFARYNALLQPFVEANQSLGAWVSNIFLTQEGLSKEELDVRMDNIMEKIRVAANAIVLPNY